MPGGYRGRVSDGHAVRIRQTGVGTAVVEVDGRDVSSLVRTVTWEMEAGQPASLVLELTARATLDLECAADVRVVDGDYGDALRLLSDLRQPGDPAPDPVRAVAEPSLRSNSVRYVPVKPQ
jgi:hypothetical protein